jgi:transcriptional regulator with XRE-family HTH domain
MKKSREEIPEEIGKEKGDPKALGEDLKAARLAAGRSLNGAARPAKISPAYLQKLEAGIVKNPSPPVLQRLGDVLGVPYDRLMELAGYALPSAEQSGGGPREHRLEKALLSEGLSKEERKAVRAFIACLKGQR